MSPQQFIISKKLNYALELIKQQGADISEAALLSGFSDISAFSKTFKKHYGCSPSKFQN
jgi:AraC-like DNA-binding protein